MSVSPGDLVGGQDKYRESQALDESARPAAQAENRTTFRSRFRAATRGTGREKSPVPRKASPPPAGFNEITTGAVAGAAAEKRMSIRQGFQTYPKAVAWSAVLSLAIVMEGYDVTLLPNLYAFPPFVDKFGGAINSDGQLEVTAPWQVGLTNGANIGEIIGLFATGHFAEKYGYRKTMMAALGLVAMFIFITFFSQSLPMLLVGEILCGIPWGVFQTCLSPSCS